MSKKFGCMYVEDNPKYMGLGETLEAAYEDLKEAITNEGEDVPSAAMCQYYELRTLRVDVIEKLTIAERKRARR